MRSRIALLIMFLAMGSRLAGAYWLDGIAVNTPDLRRAFLLGMSEELDYSGAEKFWPTEKFQSDLYDAVAKEYAADVGIVVANDKGKDWRSEVARSLDDQERNRKVFGTRNIEARVAFLSGAYARFGTPTGFKLTGYAKAFEIGLYICNLADYDIQIAQQSGYPGGTSITVLGADGTPTAQFFNLMRRLEASARMVPNQSTGSGPAPTRPPSGQETRHP